MHPGARVLPRGSVEGGAGASGRFEQAAFRVQSQNQHQAWATQPACFLLGATMTGKRAEPGDCGD